MRALVLLALLPWVAFGQGFVGPVSRGGPLKARQYSSNAAINLFVDVAGNDANACTSTGAAACLTIQGAINKAPKLLLDPVLITVGAGSFAGGFINGFAFDNGKGLTSTGVYIEIDGTLTNATATSGSPTGTATGGSAGTGSTFGTLINTGAGWTVNNFRGLLVTIVSGTGSGQYRVVDSNTSTTLTVVGTWTAPSTDSVYAIQDWATNITSGPVAPKSSTFATVGATQAGFRTGSSSQSEERMTFRWMKFTTANGLELRGNGLNQIAECSLVTTGTSVLLSAGGTAVVVRSNFTVAASQVAYSVLVGQKTFTSQNNLYRGASSSLNRVIGGGGLAFASIWIGDSFENMADGIRGQNINLTNSRFDTISGACVSGNSTSATTPNLLSSGITSSTNNFVSCGIAMYATPGSMFQADNATGATNTVSIQLEYGAKFESASTNALTGSTDISIDGTAVTQVALRALTPKVYTDLTTTSSIYER